MLKWTFFTWSQDCDILQSLYCEMSDPIVVGQITLPISEWYNNEKKDKETLPLYKTEGMWIGVKTRKVFVITIWFNGDILQSQQNWLKHFLIVVCDRIIDKDLLNIWKYELFLCLNTSDLAKQFLHFWLRLTIQ